MVMPLSVHSYYPAAAAKDDEEVTQLPAGARVVHLQLGAKGNQVWHDAQLAVKERFHTVPMGTIAVAAMGLPRGEPALRVKVEKYAGTLFFGITPPGSAVKLMYTPVASQRRHEVQQMEEGGDATRKMVVVVPKAVKLKITNAEDNYMYSNDGDKPE